MPKANTNARMTQIILFIFFSLCCLFLRRKELRRLPFHLPDWKGENFSPLSFFCFTGLPDQCIPFFFLNWGTAITTIATADRARITSQRVMLLSSPVAGLLDACVAEITRKVVVV